MHAVALLFSLLFSVTHLSPFSNAVVINHPTKPIISFCAGESHACAVFNNNKMKCWGLGTSYGSANNYGTNSSTVGDYIPYFNAGTSQFITRVQCTATTTCILLSTKKIKCVGNNVFGQTGIGVAIDYVGESTNYIGDSLPTVDLGNGADVNVIYSGYSHTCALLADNKVKCFGLNTHGELGYGDRRDRGRSADDMGNNLLCIDFGTGTSILSFHTGIYAYHNCVILSDPPQLNQRVKCWGWNLYEPLGYAADVFIYGAVGGSPGQMGEYLPAVDFGTESRAKQIAMGLYYTCTLLVNDVLKCYGFTTYGQCGSGSSNSILNGAKPAPVVSIDPGKTIRWITAGKSHTCIVYDDLVTMKCVGDNSAGQLGQGDNYNRGGAPTTKFPDIPAINLGTGSLQLSYIYSGYYFNCVLFKDSSVKCFGAGSNGQLGIGSADNVGYGANQMGNNLQFTQLFSPTKSPTGNPTNAPTKNPTNPTKPPSKNPTRAPSIAPTPPTSNPTYSPTRKCNYDSAKLCKYDIKCIWQKINNVKQCVIFDCATLNKSKCGKERTRCKWKKQTSLCEAKV